MKRDEIKQILGESVTEEQITNLLNKYHSSEESKSNEIAKLNEKLKDYETLQSKNAELEREKEQERLSKMTEQEKFEAMKKEVEQNLKDSRITKNKAKVMTLLAGIDIDEEIIDSIVGEDEGISLSKATKLVNKFNSLKDEVAKQTKEKLTQMEQLPNMNNAKPSDDVMTWEKYTKLSNEEQNKFAQEHPNEFKNL